MDLITSIIGIFGYIWPFLFILTIIVFIHELGHFLAARFFGVQVEEFSVGFGKELFGYTDKKGTRWKFSLVPLGGYVKMLGDADPSGMTQSEPVSEDAFFEEHAFVRKSLWARSIIVFAGPLANFVLTFLIFLFFILFLGERVSLPRIDDIVPNSAAQKAGFQIGDVIKTLNEQPVESFKDISKVTIISAGKKLYFTVKREGDILPIVATPEIVEKKDENGNILRIGRLGIISKPTTQDYTHKQYGFFGASSKALSETYYMMKQTVHFASEMIVGRQDTSQLGGPVRIAQISGEVAQYGLLPLLQLVAMLSISIGIINLLPLPILDGGHLLFYIIEAIRGKPLSSKVQQSFMTVGMSLLLILMVFVTFNDIVSLLG